MAGGEGEGAAFKLHPEAALDITEIWEFVAEESPKAAGRVRDSILAANRQLVSFPNQGRTRADLTSRRLRFRTAGNYVIVYAPDQKPLHVIAVIHGRRSPRVMAAILRGRE